MSGQEHTTYRGYTIRATAYPTSGGTLSMDGHYPVRVEVLDPSGRFVADADSLVQAQDFIDLLLLHGQEPGG